MLEKIYKFLSGLFWLNITFAVILVPVFPVLTAYREWRAIERSKESDSSVWVQNFSIKKEWWLLLRTHYQSKFEQISYYSKYKKDRKIQKNK